MSCLARPGCYISLPQDTVWEGLGWEAQNAEKSLPSLPTHCSSTTLLWPRHQVSPGIGRRPRPGAGIEKAKPETHSKDSHVPNSSQMTVLYQALEESSL